MKIFLIFLSALVALSCNNNKEQKEKKEETSDVVIMAPGATNRAKLKDSLVIYETVCGNCVVNFAFDDSASLVKLDKIITINTEPANLEGAVDKHIYFIPQKEGKTKLKVYKFHNNKPTASDSSVYDVYNIEIKD